jgi:hypothetical protein
MLKKNQILSSPSPLGFLQAVGVTLYCAFVGVIFWKGNTIFGQADRYVAPVAFLLLFIASAMICALIVFYRPYQLFFDGKKREALEAVVHTAAWLFLAFAAFMTVMFLR